MPDPLPTRAGSRELDDVTLARAQRGEAAACRALSAFDRGGRARLSTWILTIATRLCIDELRKQAQTEPLEKAGHVAAPARSDARLEARAIARAVAALAPEYRAAFLLRELHDLEYDEIARALGVDLGTVKSRLARARAALREALAEEPHEA